MFRAIWSSQSDRRREIENSKAAFYGSKVGCLYLRSVTGAGCAVITPRELVLKSLVELGGASRASALLNYPSDAFKRASRLQSHLPPRSYDSSDQRALKIFDSSSKSIVQFRGWLPLQLSFSQIDIWSPSLRIVHGQRLIYKLTRRVC